MPRLTYLILLLFATCAKGHELWLEPSAFYLESASPVKINVKNGEHFSGIGMGYVPQRVEQFLHYHNNSTKPLGKLVGDRPAATIETLQAGLHIMSYESTDQSLTYKAQEKFAKFVKDKALNLGDTPPQNNTPFDETYRRFAKTLVGVGDVSGKDRRLGLLHELVLQDNPYTDTSLTIRAKLYYQDALRAHAQVEVFERQPNGEVTQMRYKTDANGEVMIPTKAKHQYLLNAVVLEALTQTSAPGAIWHTNWASLTFARP